MTGHLGHPIKLTCFKRAKKKKYFAQSIKAKLIPELDDNEKNHQATWPQQPEPGLAGQPVDGAAQPGQPGLGAQPDRDPHRPALPWKLTAGNIVSLQEWMHGDKLENEESKRIFLLTSAYISPLCNFMSSYFQTILNFIGNPEEKWPQNRVARAFKSNDNYVWPVTVHYILRPQTRRQSNSI